MSTSQSKPVAIETRKDLLFRAPRRTSTKAIWILAIAAFGFGILLSAALKDLVHVERDEERTERTRSGPVMYQA